MAKNIAGGDIGGNVGGGAGTGGVARPLPMARGIYSVHASFGFADVVARHLIDWARHEDSGGLQPSGADKKSFHEDWRERLARVSLYLPNRRSMAVMTGALLHAAQQTGHGQKTVDGVISGGLLLPKMVSLGDIGDDILDITDMASGWGDDTVNRGGAMFNDEMTANAVPDDGADGAIETIGGLFDILGDKAGDRAAWQARLLAEQYNSIGTAERLELLMGLIEEFYRGDGGLHRRLTPGHLLRLAKQLARFLDELTIAQFDHQQLLNTTIGEGFLARADDTSQKITDNLAEHWQRILSFLKIIVTTYPAYLQEKNKIDRETAINKKMELLADFYKQIKPTMPVLVAGSTGSRASTRLLMQAVLTLPRGMVILPGFDKNIDPDLWQFLSESVVQDRKKDTSTTPFFVSALVHPQRMMVKLLADLGLTADAVQHLGQASIDPLIAARQELLAMIFLPPISNWQEQQARIARASMAMNGLTILATDNVASEAKLVALIIKKQLVENNKTITVISRNQPFTRQLLLELASFGIVIEDSSGTPFWRSDLGIFLSAVSYFFSRPTALSLAHLVNHHAVYVGRDFATARRYADYLVLSILPEVRGVLTANKIEQAMSKARASGIDKADMLAWLQPLLALLADDDRDEQKKLSTWVDALLALVAKINRGPEQQNSMAGDVFASTFAGHAIRRATAILANYAQLPQTASFIMARQDLHEWLQELFAEEMLHQPFLQSERLKIVGTLESRLLKSDITIMTGLLEGVWPARPSPDPWLPRPLRQQWHLPLAEEKLSMSAHDFSINFLSPEVFITSHKKQDGVAVEKSRWLQRLEALLMLANPAMATGKWGNGNRSEGMAAIDADDDLPLMASNDSGGNYYQAMQRRADEWYDILARAEQRGAAHNLPRPTRPNPTPPLIYRPRQLSVTEVERWAKNPFAIYAKRVLRLKKPEEIARGVDKSDWGTLVHELLQRFLTERVAHRGRELLFLNELSDELLRSLQDFPVVKNFWSTMLYESCDWFWQQYEELPLLESHGEVAGQAMIAHQGGDFCLTARADRLDIFSDRICLLDYKTGQVATTTKRQAGESLQLPLEGLIAKKGGFAPLQGRAIGNIDLELWRVKGRDSAVVLFDKVSGKGKNNAKDMEQLIEQAEEKLNELLTNLFDPAMGFEAQEGQDYNDYDLLAREGEWSSMLTEEEEQSDGQE